MAKTGAGLEQTEYDVTAVVDTLETFVKTEVSNLGDKVKAELQKENTWRKLADDKVNRKVDKETELRIEQVNEAKNSAQELSSQIETKIEAEVSRAKQSEQDLLVRSQKIATWASDGSSIDDLNGGLLYKESKRAIQEESKIIKNLNTEINRATTAENEIKATLQKELSNINLPDVIKKTGTNQAITGGLNVDELSVANLEADKATIDSISVVDKAELSGTLTSTAGIETVDHISVNKGDVTNYIQLQNGSISTKDLTVRGNLTVLGAQKIETQDTLEVKNNLIVLRQGAETAPTTPSGVVIYINENKTVDNAYGIVYNPANDSVDLSYGLLKQSTGNDLEFQPNASESNPLLVRDSSDNIIDGNLIRWHREKRTHYGHTCDSVKAVDSGISFDTLRGTISECNRLRTDFNAEVETQNEINIALQNSINAETDRATTFEEQLNNSILQLQNGLQEESDLRKSTFDSLSERISTVESASEDFDARLTEETQTREAKDTAILNSAKDLVNTEKSRATKEESILNTNLSSLQSTVGILSDKVNQYVGIQDKFVANINTAIQNEAQARKDEDSTIRTEIDSAVANINSTYAEVKQFYDAFVEARKVNPDKLLACYWSTELNKPKWVTVDNGEL